MLARTVGGSQERQTSEPDWIVTRSNLLGLLGQLSTTRELWGPVARDEPDCEPPVRYFYEQVTSPERIALHFSSSVHSPRALLLPPRETLFSFDRTKRQFTTTTGIDVHPRALVGVHPCDVNAMRLLDAVFMQEVPDEHVAARRANLFVIGVDCAAPCCDEAFCRDMNANEAVAGFDVMLVPLDVGAEWGGAPSADDRFGVLIGSAAGREWFEQAPDRVRKPDAIEARDYDAYLARKDASFPRRLHVDRERARQLALGSYASYIYAAEAARCYSCGSCNLVCPTCTCFDIRDQNDLPTNTGFRERCWDACMLHDFAVVAGGHNFRPEASERLRHRVMRKMAWMEQRAGLPGCVGCARCDRACTAGISLVDIMNQLAREPEPEHVRK